MATQKAKRTKRPDRRPARDRYWSQGKLEQHKVRNLVRCCGMELTKARRFWLSVRKRRKRGVQRD